MGVGVVEHVVIPVALDDLDARRFGALECREAMAAGRALASASYRPAVVSFAGIDHGCVHGAAVRTVQRTQDIGP